MFTLDDVRLLIVAVDTLINEYGETDERMDLRNRLDEERDRLRLGAPLAEQVRDTMAYYGV